MNTASTNRLAQLMPEFARRVKLIVERLAEREFEVEITQGLRSIAYQDALYSQGRTREGPIVTNARGGRSHHNYGLAADFALMVDVKDEEGKPIKDEEGKPIKTYGWPDPHAVWKAIAEEAKRAGLNAGYDWKKKDKPHVQWPNVTWQTLLSWHNQGGLEKVWMMLGEPAGSVPPVTKPVLRLGDRGVAVELLQTKLGIKADGIFGPVTEKAVREFQDLNGLTVDSIVGKATWGKLGDL